MKPLLPISIAALAAATFLGAEPSAYSFSGPSWPLAQMTYVVNAVNLDLSGVAADMAVRAGADAWQQQTGAFRFLYAGSSSQTTNTNDGVNLVLFRNASSGSAIATTYWWSSGGRIIDADVVFWDEAFKFFAGSSGCSGGFYIEDIAVHEFGHALGLGHSTVAAATMYPSTSACNVQNRSLDADDIAGAWALYPSGQPPSAPTNFRMVR
jgi:poly(3-hydroxybutyrate) depolymerase